jgi:hypothetical protein
MSAWRTRSASGCSRWLPPRPKRQERGSTEARPTSQWKGRNFRPAQKAGFIVEVSNVLAILKANAATAARMLVALATSLPEERPPSSIDTVLDYAIVTPPERRDPQAMTKLEAVCRRVLQADRG